MQSVSANTQASTDKGAPNFSGNQNTTIASQSNQQPDSFTGATGVAETPSSSLSGSDTQQAQAQTQAQTQAQPSFSTQSQDTSMSNDSVGTNIPASGLAEQSIGSNDIKKTVGSGPDSLSDAQLAAAASLQAAVNIPSSVGTTSAPQLEEVAQPHVDGEKIEAMMKSVTKELGMRDLSQLKLGGEMTLKLDQGALPNTEVKVRFEGNEMVISIDSQTAEVNSFCTDNLALLQQSVSSGMKDDMKVRIEVRNPPDQPNQRKDGQSGGNSGNSGNGSSSQQGNQGDSNQSRQQQSQQGDSLAN